MKKVVAIVGGAGSDSKLMNAVKKAGSKIVFLKVITVKKMKLKRAGAQILNHIDDYQWIVFTSKNSVNFFVEELRVRNISLPKKVKIAAIGTETAAELRLAKLKVNLIPKKFNTKELVRAMKKKVAPIKNHKIKILFPRSAIASSEVIDDLRYTGAHVDILHLYTVTPAKISPVVINSLKKTKIDSIIFTSSSGVTAFAEKNKNIKKQLGGVSVICIGPVTAESARSYGFKKIHTAKTSTTEGIVNLLRRLP